jgi:ATP-dependent DNA helicase RecG
MRLPYVFKIPVWDLSGQVVKLTFFSKAKIDGAIDGVAKIKKDKIAIVLKAIVAHEGLKNQDYVDITGISNVSIERYLRDLKKAGFIEFIGAPQTGGYYLTEKTKLLLSEGTQNSKDNQNV